MGEPVVIEVDARDLPIVRVRWPSVSASAADVERFARDMEHAYARAGRLAVIVDATHAAPIGPRALARAIALERRARVDLLVARAIVVSGAIAARVLSRALRTLPHRVPTRAFDDAREAEAWARSRL